MAERTAFAPSTLPFQAMIRRGARDIRAGACVRECRGLLLVLDAADAPSVCFGWKAAMGIH